MRIDGLALIVMGMLAGFSPSARAQSCTSEQLGAEVDAAGAKLRSFNANTMRALDVDLKRLQRARGWSDAARSVAIDELFASEHLAALDREAYQHFSTIEDLSNGPAGPVDCARLDELRRRVETLLGVMERKRQAMVALVAGALGETPPKVAPTVEAETKVALAPQAPAAERSALKQSATQQPVLQPTAPKPTVIKKPEAVPTEGWGAKAVLAPDQPAPPMPKIESTTVAGLPTPFTADEITAASKGLFGGASAHVAGIITHAFRTVGRPNGYIMGDEGGGAFVAGVRYGTGKLYLKDGTEQRVYWHGPSIGFDFGASGSRTLFLVYNLKRPEDVFGPISGVDGTAYVVGGIGMTLLTNGEIVMAPIRTGLGLRLGANAGYLRFSSSPSWLPF